MTITVIFLFALAVRLVTALPLQQPGYMDAYYYYDGGESLYRGGGFNEDFIWNYLDDPQGLPRPSHLYWMPLSSILVYFSFLLFGASYRAAQMPFILLSSFLPLIAYYISYRISGQQRHALSAALFTIFSGFYLVYWVSPDNLSPFAVTASLSLVVMAEGLKSGNPWTLGLTGFLAGLSHLARADGPLLLLSLFIAVLVEAWRRRRKKQRIGENNGLWRMANGGFLCLPGIRPLLLGLLFALAGYLLIMMPWFYRNWRVIGTPLSGAGVKTLFLRDYDDLYSYNDRLTWGSYLAWGWGSILRSKLEAAWLNLQTLLAVDLMIFLAPLAAIGLWQLRRQGEFLPFFIYGPLLYLTMTLVFTFPGFRGGMLHSSTALLPHLFAAAMIGLDTAVIWLARFRPWHVPTAQKFFTTGFVLLALFLSAFIYHGRILGGQPFNPTWNQRDLVYGEIAAWLEEHAPPQAAVMVGNPPSFYYHSGRPCVVVPNEGLEAVLQIARRYEVDYLVLDENRPHPLAEIYSDQVEVSQLELQLTLTDRQGKTVKIYRINGVRR